MATGWMIRFIFAETVVGKTTETIFNVDIWLEFSLTFRWQI
jgi:hypothetical protein